MTDLCKLAVKYGTDKIHYTPFYSLLLEGRRYSQLRVLEIGIGTSEAMKHVAGYRPGASLRMWEEYFPYSEIFGIDKDPSVLFSTNRIKTLQADQSALVPFALDEPFALIVDDGSHTAVDQMTALGALLPRCRWLYIVEDADRALLPMLDAQGYKYTYALVRGVLTGRCVVISG